MRTIKQLICPDLIETIHIWFEFMETIKQLIWHDLMETVNHLIWPDLMETTRHLNRSDLMETIRHLIWFDEDYKMFYLISLGQKHLIWFARGYQTFDLFWFDEDYKPFDLKPYFTLNRKEFLVFKYLNNLSDTHCFTIYYNDHHCELKFYSHAG